MSKRPHIAVLGGGTGSFVVASGLVKAPVDVSMLMTMMDDGGSNRVIRDEFGLLPTSGIRQAIVALSENQTVLRQLFSYRFHQGGKDISGMTFGNLFMAAMADIMGSQQKGIEETCKLLQVKGEILPTSYDDVRLVATYSDGTQIIGEHQIDEFANPNNLKIKKLTTQPKAKLNLAARQALLSADLIVIGPGDFYTNTVSNLIVKDMINVLKKTSAKIVFITNLMTKQSETPNYKLSDFFTDLKKYLPLELIDYVLINNNLNYSPQALKLYEAENAQPINDDLTKQDINHGVKIIRTDLLSPKVATTQTGDQLARSMIRHDPDKLVKQFIKLVK